ncbi:protein angel homolog 2 [Ciona intestinalis]
MLAGRFDLLGRWMASSYPHKFVPAQWVKSAQRQLQHVDKKACGVSSIVTGRKEGSSEVDRHKIAADRCVNPTRNSKTNSSTHPKFKAPWNDRNSQTHVWKNKFSSSYDRYQLNQNWNGHREKQQPSYKYGTTSSHCIKRSYFSTFTEHSSNNDNSRKLNNDYHPRHPSGLKSSSYQPRRRSSEYCDTHDGHHSSSRSFPPSNKISNYESEIGNYQDQVGWNTGLNHSSHLTYNSHGIYNRRKNFHHKPEKLRRHWVQVSTSKQAVKHLRFIPTTQQDSFSIMSYNILAQKLLDINSYLYSDCDPDVLQWDFRWPNLMKEMSIINSDIICLQEVEECHYEAQVKPWLESRGYNFSYKKRTGSDPTKPDGVLTACRSNKFHIVDAIPVEYYRQKDELTKCHNVGLILMLKMLHPDMNGATVCIGNTHLLYNPKRGDIKMIQLATFFAAVRNAMQNSLKQTGIHPSLVLCGDFNSTPSSPLYQFVTSGHINYQGMSAKQISGQSTSGGLNRELPAVLLPQCLNINGDCTQSPDESSLHGIKHTLTHGFGNIMSSNQPHKLDEATTMQNNGATVDYIFYSENNKLNVTSCQSNQPKFCVKLKLRGRLSHSLAKDVYKVGGIPNTLHSSDHLPVLAEFGVSLLK